MDELANESIVQTNERIEGWTMVEMGMRLGRVSFNLLAASFSYFPPSS